VPDRTSGLDLEPHGGGLMSDPIRLSDHVFIRACRLLDFGETAEARRLLGRLTGQGELRAGLRAVAHQLQGQLDLLAQRFRRARRHFAAAIRLQPFDAESYFRYAGAVEANPDANPRRGWMALRKAVDLNPVEPRYWAALGRTAVRLGDHTKAIRCFRRAARLRPERAEVLEEIVDGLVSLGRRREAAAVLNAARFRAPADPALRQTVNRFRFDLVRREQEAARGGSAGGPVVLHFPGRPAEPAAAPATSPTIVRVDRGSLPAPHVLRMFGADGGPRRAR
jgi:tetratricopeptide (TPR) repeat protein